MSKSRVDKQKVMKSDQVVRIKKPWIPITQSMQGLQNSVLTSSLRISENRLLKNHASESTYKLLDSQMAKNSDLKLKREK